MRDFCTFLITNNDDDKEEVNIIESVLDKLTLQVTPGKYLAEQ